MIPDVAQSGAVAVVSLLYRFVRVGVMLNSFHTSRLTLRTAASRERGEEEEEEKPDQNSNEVTAVQSR